MQAKKSNPVETMLGIATGFALLHAWLQVDWLLYVAIGAGLIGLFFKGWARWVEWGWMKITRLIGFVNSRVILSAVFFLILLPIALLWRMSRKNPLQLKKNDTTYFVERNHPYTSKDLENPW